MKFSKTTPLKLNVNGMEQQKIKKLKYLSRHIISTVWRIKPTSLEYVLFGKVVIFTKIRIEPTSKNETYLLRVCFSYKSSNIYEDKNC